VAALRLCRLRLEPVEITDVGARKGGLTKLSRSEAFAFLGANLRQFSRIQPIAAAVGTLIDLDPALGAEEVSMQANAGTARAIAFARRVDLDPIIPFDMKQRFASRFLFLVDALKLESVEPDAATAVLADIHHQAANLCLRQFVEAGGAFHGTILPQCL
jgi:hypothetical protein